MNTLHDRLKYALRRQGGEEEGENGGVGAEQAIGQGEDDGPPGRRVVNRFDLGYNFRP